uniref:Myb-like domain-containing protein n=1 Tax=Setaria digitata TaxID=48799 RepID=A0A915PFF1_9BILA
MNEATADNIICCNCEVSLVPAKCMYIQCDSCQKKGFDVRLCVHCFRMGAECGPHKRGHAYTVADRKGPSLFRTTSGTHWGWKEDLKLIKAAHKHKLGNWEEIASELGTNKTADDARKRFDQFFIRGSFGRYAAGSSSWPCIDDHTGGEISLSQPDPDLSGQGHAPDSSNWRYISEFFRDWNQAVNFDDPNWFEQFKEPLMKFRDEFYTPPLLSPGRKSSDERQSFERNDSSHLITPPLSPISVEFIRTDDQGRRKRLLSVSDFDESDGEGTTNSESSNSYECKSELAAFSSKKRNDTHNTHIYQNSSVALQSTDEGSESEQKYERKKPVLQLKRVGKKRRKKDEEKLFLKEACEGKLVIRINEDVKKRLREFYPEQFYANIPLLPFGAEERSKLKDGDLQLLGYMPEREDFEWEFINDAEKLISRLMLQPGPDADEDSAFETAVKLARVQKYNRILKQRRAKKAAIREYELVNKFFDKIKKIEETRRNLMHNQQYSATTRQRELFHSFMKKTYQVVRHSELNQLLDAITSYVNLNERIMNLEGLKVDGIKDLKEGHIQRTFAYNTVTVEKGPEE